MEPGCHLYYFGVNLKNVGGINFDRTSNLMNRIIRQARNDSTIIKPSSVEFAQPYFNWEASLGEYGLKAPDEATQSYVSTGFKGLFTFTSGLFTDERYAHVRMKK